MVPDGGRPSILESLSVVSSLEDCFLNFSLEESFDSFLELSLESSAGVTSCNFSLSCFPSDFDFDFLSFETMVSVIVASAFSFFFSAAFSSTDSCSTTSETFVELPFFFFSFFSSSASFFF